MRLGATIDDYLNTDDPDALVAECRKKGYRAAAMPLEVLDQPATVRDIASALDRADILLAEMAAWVNPFRPLGVIPGHGILDYATFLRRAEGLGPDLPLILEHLQTETNFDEAAAHIKRVCTAAGVSL